jgi:hypothetical protein
LEAKVCYRELSYRRKNKEGEKRETRETREEKDRIGEYQVRFTNTHQRSDCTP